MLSDIVIYNHFKGSFREAIWPFLMIGQLFGIMPIIGIKSKSSADLIFSWINARTIYSFIITAILLTYTLLLMFESFYATDEILSTIAIIAFYALTSFGYISFFALARKWPALIRQWEVDITKLPSFRDQNEKDKFVRGIRIISILVLFLALIEHSLSTISTLGYVMMCHSDKDTVSQLMKLQFPYLFTSYDEVPLYEAILAKFIGFCAGLMWNYMDIFLISVSIDLSTRFKLFNAELMRTKYESMPLESWVYRRIQYGRLCNLVEKIDAKISHITLFSFMGNLIFTCKQLFQCLRPFSTTGKFRMAYYWFSLFFLIFRLASVSFFASSINDESKKPLNILRALPSRSWNVETKRFYNDIINDTVALSGMRFFHLTRKLILSMAATIVTYELVLLQFNIQQAKKGICKSIA